MKKKIVNKVISFVLAASMLLPTNSVALAEGSEGKDDGNSPIIEISSREDLQKISEDLDGNYALSENIELQGGEFVPIGTDEAPFTGTFDGKGHVISNMHITVSASEEDNSVGLFGNMENAKVQNLAIENAAITSQITGSISAGIVAGKMKNSLVEDSYVSGIITSEGTGEYRIGGIAGVVFQDSTENAPGNEKNLSRCVTNVSIGVVEGTQGQRGALAGHVDNTALIKNSYSLIQDMPLFGAEISEGNSCQNLGEEKWANQENYVGFDFENVWKITNHGARLITQAEESLEEGTAEESLEEGTAEESPEEGTAEGEDGKEDGSGKNEIEEAEVEEEVSKDKQKKEAKNTASNTGEEQAAQNKEGISAQIDTHAISDGGTQENPTEIVSESDLLELVEMAKSSQITGYYSLANDIKLTTDNWTGIGTSSNCCFAGVFEGNGYTVTGLKVSGKDHDAGLFAYNKGTIRNLTVDGSITDGKNYAGILCAYNEGIIENCHSTGRVDSDITRGGLVGHNVDKGIVGQSSSQAAVKGEGSTAGGLVGYNTGKVQYSYASGSVSGSNSVGGLIGGGQWGEVSDSYAAGNVSGSSSTGGLVGYLYHGNVRGCYARGSVNGGDGCGLVGYQDSGSIKFSYYNSANTGNKKGFAETTTKLKRQETYYGWDFVHIWEMGEDSYPSIKLRGEAEEIKIEGNGEEDNPYVIENEMQLFALSTGKLPATQKKYYKLGNDIELTSGNWSMIWEFNGVFDGSGNTISGLKSVGTDYENVGLFGTNKGTIKNLSVIGSITDGRNYAGILCGSNEGSIENCSTSGTINSNINRGGLVGYNADKGMISQSSSQAAVKGDGSTAGGLVGYSTGKIQYSYASGSVSGSSSVGGLVGSIQWGEVRDSYASGNVTGDSRNSGGLVGYMYHGNVRGCYARGSVNGGEGCGLVGYLDSGSIKYSYYNSANTGNKKGFAETATKLKRQETYYGWDFAHIWEMGENGYPSINLRGEADEIAINGNGEEEDPYIIENEMQLFALSTGKLPATQKKYYKLGNDIELTSDNWSMIWEFNGIFDGSGHTISSLKSIGTDYENVGLFGVNKGTIRNLSVIGSITDGRNYAGILCGSNEGNIENCNTSGTINSNITRGGLVGYNTDKGAISQSCSQVIIKGDGSMAGGLVGYNTGKVRYSHASGSVSGSSSVGGLVGSIQWGEVRDSYASGNVTGDSGNSGGLVGYMYHGNVRGCYARGSVNGGEGCGLVGYLDSGSIKYSYYNSANTGNKKGFAETATKLKRQETYYGWDFAHIWEMGENGYPSINLRGEADEIAINGNGEEEDPYIIENEMQLFALSTGKLPATQKKYYKLGNDIELTSGNWSMIWEFNGVFDGSGNTISGLKSIGTDYENVGLFGVNKGTIRNLSVIGSITEGRNYAGILCGSNEGSIENCSTSGTINSNVTRGGLVGYNTDKGVISQSVSQATVKGDGSTAGGLVGRSTGTVCYSHASGSVSGSSNVGGLIGDAGYKDVSDSYASGNVSGSNGNSGGLVGSMYHGNVRGCYARGSVNGGDGCGLVGYLDSGNVRHSYYNAINTGNKIGFGETVTKLKKQATYYGWDFVHIWKMGEDGYPCISLRGKADEVEINGNGEEDDPYLIENEMQLFALSSGRLPATQKKYYKLENDIQLTADNWGMIWEFNGTFDGAGHTISGLKSVGTNYTYAGLFGKNMGTIKNLSVEGIISNSSNYYAALICAYNTGTIENCFASGAVSASCCRGGIVGYNEGAVTMSRSSVTISGNGGAAGALVGRNTKKVESSYAEGKVNGTNSIGGLVGENSGTIENTYAAVSVSGSSNIGGLVGYHSGTVKNSYSMGNVSAEYSSHGGLIGYCSGTVISSYYNKNKSGCEDTDKGTPLSNLQMKDEKSFEDWDFTEVWGIYNSINGGFPFLQVMFSEYEEEDSDFWYSVRESKKGYAFVNQKMGIFYNASPDSQVEYKVEYIGSDGKSNISTVAASYDQNKQAFAGEFEIAEGMQQISSIKAQVTDGITKEIPFTSSFWYQMPLKVEGTMHVVFNDDIINSSSMMLKVFKDGQCIYKTVIDGGPTITVHSLETGTDYKVAIYGEGIEYASLDGIQVTQGLMATIDFSHAAKMASLGVEFYVDGVEISNKELKAVFYDKTIGKSRLLGSGKYLEFLSEGDTIGYSVSMGNQLAKTYKADSKVYTITLKEGENIAKVELERFQTVEISGSVYEQDGVTAIPGVKVTAVQQLNGIHSITTSGNTDSSGKIELSGKDTETTITLSKKGYLTTTFTVEASQLGKIERKMERAQGRIQFGVSYLQAAKEDAEDIEEKYNLLPDKIMIHNDTQNKMLTDVQNQWPNLYVETRQISAGDTLNITVSKGGYATTDLKATVLENGNAKVTGALLQYGGMELTLEREDGIASAKSHLMVYGEDGKKFSYKRGITKPCSFTGLPAGSYTIVSADESVAIDSYYQLKDLKENKDLVGLYFAKAVQVQDGIIVSERISVPAIEEKEAYLDVEKSGISINNASAMVGDTIVVRAEVTFRTKAKKEGAKAELALPTGTRYVENSLTINGKESAITPKNNVLSIPIEGKNAVIRYRVKVLATITASSVEFNGMACYSIDGENYINSIGKAELNINELTLIVPPKTRTNTFIARGIAEKNASIRIYDGDVLVGSVTANKYGAYRIEVTLPEDEINRIHYLKAVNQETKAESEQAQVICGNTDIDVIGFKVIHNGKTYDVGDPSVEVGNLNLTMVPSAPFEFIAYFTENESVALVQTEIELTNGNIQSVDMEYNDAMGYWYGEVTLDSNRIPNVFNVSYIETKFVYEDNNSSEEGWENISVETIGIKTSDDINPNIAVVEKVTYDDPENTELYILDNLQENVKFTPDEGYIQTEYNNCKVYINPVPVLLECDILYFMANEMYFELPDGTYTLWQRGIGLEDTEKSERNMQVSFASRGIQDWFKGVVVKIYDWYVTHVGTVDETIETSKEMMEYNKKIKKITGFTDKLEEQREAIKKAHDTHTPKELAERAKETEEYLKEIAENGTGAIKELAKFYQQELRMYKMLDEFTGSFDIIKTYVKQSNALEDFSDIEIKAYEKFLKVGRDKLSAAEEKCVESMETAAISYYSKGYNEVIEKILNDERLKNALKELKEKRAYYRWEHRKDGKSSEEEGLITQQTVSRNKISVDPSGYVYETFEDNRIQGVTATLYYENDMGDMQIWDAEEYNQENPLITDNDGNYAWDVPEGLWQVVYTKEGYETVSSKKMVVPPPQLDVNIAMVSTEPAEISKISNIGDKLKITFDKYLLVDTILKDGIQIKYKDKVVDTKICINKNDIRDYNGEQVVKELELQLEGGLFVAGQTYQIIQNSGIKTYAGVSLMSNTVPYVAESEADPVSITIPDGVKVYLDESEISSGDLLYQNDRIKVVAEAAEGYRLTSLTINNAEVVNGTYFTVGKGAIVINVSYERMPEESYIISATVGRGGMITPSGDTEVLRGMDQAFRIQANSGYVIDDVKVDGKSVGAISDYTFSKVIENHTIEAFFQKSDAIKVESIILSQSEGTLEVGKTMLLQADIMPQNAKDKQLKWSSSNPEVASVENGLVTAIGEGSTVITAESQDGGGVSATCKIEVTDSGKKKEYTIISSSGIGGKITPEGTITVTEGEGKTFAIMADEGYIIRDVEVDGRSIGAVSSYTMSDIKENHTIAASFQKPASVKVEKIELSHSEVSLEVGKTLLLNAAVTPDNAENKQLKWSSNNRQVAVVENGLVAAIGEGSAVITAESQDGSNVSSACKIEVTSNSKKKEYTIAAFSGTGGKIDPEGMITVTEGESKTFAVTADYGYVIQDVKVDGKSVGAVASYTITDIKGNHTIAASFQKPESVKVGKITLSQSEASLEIGKILLLEAIVTPDNAENKQLKWSSDNHQVALVDNGLISAIGEGSATITAVSQDGSEVSASCKIKVENSSKKKEYTVIAFAGIGGKITPEGTITVTEGGSKTFAITADYGYTIQDVKVDGKSVGAVASYTITDIKDNHTIAVSFQKTAAIKVEKIALSQSQVSLEIGKTLLLEAVITPDNAENKQLKWSSDNRQIALVDNGLVAAIGEGSATITVESQDGSGISASCRVTVQKANPGPMEKGEQSITGTPSYAKTYGDALFKLDTALEKGNGILSYISSNPKVAEVSDEGEVRITGTGEASITITASETDEYKKCEYQVSVKVAKAIQRISGTVTYSKMVGSKPFRLNAKRTVGDGKLSYLSTVPTVAAVSNSGMVTIKKPGNTIITVIAAATANYNACTFRIKLSVTAPKKGTMLTEPKTKAKYKVTDQGKSVEYSKPKDKKVTKVSIPATVTISGVKYNVTGIAANAFSGCKKLKSISIGKNVEFIGTKAFASCTGLAKISIPSKVSKIGKQAFSGCKKLKDITIQSTKLTSKSVGAKAFQGIYAKATIKVPKAKRAAYQKLLKSKGIGKKVKIK